MLSFFALGLAMPAWAVELRTDYGATISGIWVGSGKLRADIGEDTYQIRFSAEVGGLARLFADLDLTLGVEGTVQEGALVPSLYEHAWREDDDAETAEIRFNGHGVENAAVEPPPRRPERRVPVTAADLAGAVDIATSLVWPNSGEVTPKTCDRTIPLFDGTQRFDLSLTFQRSTSFEARDGSYSGPATVCSVRYRPVSGHRRDKEEVGEMAANQDIEVWIAPAAEGFAIPVKMRILTDHGWFSLEALEFGEG